MQSVHPVRYSYDEYLAFEHASNVKHEYLAGQIFAMAGGTPEHASVANNVGTLLNVVLRGKRCKVYTSDLRVRALLTDLATLSTRSTATSSRGPDDRSGRATKESYAVA